MSGFIIIGIEMPRTITTLIEVGDRTVIEVKGIVTGEGEDAGTLTPNIKNRGIPNNPNTQTLIIIVHLQWNININIRKHL